MFLSALTNAIFYSLDLKGRIQVLYQYQLQKKYRCQLNLMLYNLTILKRILYLKAFWLEYFLILLPDFF